MDRATFLELLRRGLPVWAIALVMVLAAEVGARVALGDDDRWAYWNRTMATKVALLRRAEEAGRPPNLLVVGDSTAAFNIQPAVIDRIAGTRGFNLGSAGNYASSFDVTMTNGILPSLGFTPEVLLVSFASHGFDPTHVGQTTRILSSPIGRRLQGHRVWGDWLYLVRVHHFLRLLRDPPANPSIRRQQGFEPYVKALDRRRRRPGLARQLPPAPAWMLPPVRKQPIVLEDPMLPVRRLFEWASSQGIRTILVSPPADDRSWVDDLDATAREAGVPHWDFSEAPYRQHLAHLSGDDPRRFSREIGLRLKAELGR